MKNNLLVLIFITGQVLDVITTYVGIHILFLSEINPVAREMFGIIGMEGFMAIKLIIIFAFAFFYILSREKMKKWNKTLESALRIGIIGTWFIVILNIIQILFI